MIILILIMMLSWQYDVNGVKNNVNMFHWKALMFFFQRGWELWGDVGNKSDSFSQWTRGGRRHNNVNANINIFFFKYLCHCKYFAMANTNITTYKSDSFSKWTRGVRRHNNVNANTFFSPFASTIANILLIQIQIQNTKYN